MKVSFDFPLSNRKEWQGFLRVDALVEGEDVELIKVIHHDKNDRRSNVTWMLEEWCGNLCRSLFDAAINAVEEPMTDDYTMMKQ